MCYNYRFISYKYVDVYAFALLCISTFYVHLRTIMFAIIKFRPVVTCYFDILYYILFQKLLLTRKAVLVCAVFCVCMWVTWYLSLLACLFIDCAFHEYVADIIS